MWRIDVASIATSISSGLPARRSARVCSHVRMLPRSVRAVRAVELLDVLKTDAAGHVQLERDELAPVPVDGARVRCQPEGRRPGDIASHLEPCHPVQASRSTTTSSEHFGQRRDVARRHLDLNESASAAVPEAARPCRRCSRRTGRAGECASRSAEPSGLGSRLAPRSATSAASDVLTTTVALPSTDEVSLFVVFVLAAERIAARRNACRRGQHTLPPAPQPKARIRRE